ncbi:ROK family protein [Acidicapsa dinghuensis]|uniref:ROK family protein n=1 Tax=Acidicapsa dinghuensis TaxID=2218256 RepID=A0ABW1EMP7_9BACT|nr:ROK family protein [Acidicapsa dinghuensis]
MTKRAKSSASKSAAKSKSTPVRKPASSPTQGPVTLTVDIGGTGIKIMLLDASGQPLTERIRALTPTDPTPERVIHAIEELRQLLPQQLANFDRASVGFPGVLKKGVTLEAHNLHPAWAGFPLQETLMEHWKKPVRVANDASIQGYGAIFGKGVELCLTLGTGLGSSLFTNGHLCPGLELAHHPWHKKTYEDYVGMRGLKKYGKKRWNKLLQEAFAQTSQLFNWDFLHIGGGNAKHIKFDLPHNARIVSNEEGLLGGVALWRDQS